MTRRPALVTAASLAAAGLALSVVLVREHAVAHAGGTSYCAITEYVNCASVVFAGISTFAIGALCILCSACWVVSFGLLAASARAVRPEGAAAAVRGDLALLRERKRTTAGLVLSAIALVVLVSAAFPRYGPRAAAGSPGAPVPAGALVPAGAITEGASQGPIVIVEFSDYECPACARAHAETKALLAGRTGIRLSRRHCPLDSDCNPGVKRRMHPGSCDLARVGICAEAQGKLEPMEDALFANQQAHRPVEELARAVGLDMEKLRACLASPETEARLRSDIETGIRVGLRATPTFIVGGKQYPGGIPPEALPPRASAAATP